MRVHKAYKFRLYPTNPQSDAIAKTIGCSRFVYNHFLAQWQETYVKTGKGLTYDRCSAQLPLVIMRIHECSTKQKKAVKMFFSLIILKNS